MSFLHYLWSFLLALAVLIFVHELGHYLAARWCGVRVLRFAIGFGKPLWTRRFGTDQTEWCVAAIPLGGYVKMLDEREEPVPAHERGRAFNVQPIWKRSVIVAAGPFANFLLAILIYWGTFLAGTTTLAPEIGSITAGSAAERAGLLAGEQVQRIDAEVIRSWDDLRWTIIDKGLARREIEIETRSPGGSTQIRRADLSAIVVDEGAADPMEQFGLRPPRPQLPAVIGSVAPGGVAEKAGLRAGDRIVTVDGEAIADFHVLAEKIAAADGRPLRLGVERGGEQHVVEVQPEVVGEGKAARARIGIAAARPDAALSSRYLVEVNYGPFEAMVRAVQQTWRMSVFSLKVLWRMVTGEISLRNVSGPLTIADFTGQSAAAGWEVYIRSLALISISLGVLNLLPVPILDGGHLLYHALEALTGRPLSERALEIAQRCGFALLLGLMALALFNDLNRLFIR